MARKKPDVDEYLLHFRKIQRLMKKHKRIILYGVPGEGKSTIMNALKRKYGPVGWNFYHFHRLPAEEPFIWELSNPEPDPSVIPKFDVIYCIQYTTNYKESVTGVKFSDGDWRPLREYVTRAQWRERGKNNIATREAKSLSELKKIVKGE